MDSPIWSVGIAVSRNHFTKKNKIFNSPGLAENSCWPHDDMHGHVTRSSEQTAYKYPMLNQKFDQLEPTHLPNYPRRNSNTINF